jgi:type IV secretory pathway TraG/TraD family ATPase VirD4
MPDDLTRRIFFILDEFGTLQRLSSIKDLLIASRSKGGACFLGIQDMGQLNKIYTEPAANTIVNACGTSVMFSVADPQTADYLSRKIGDSEFEATEESYSAGVKDGRDGLSWSKRNKTEHLLLASQFMNLPDLHAYVKIPNVPGVTETTLTYKSYPAKTEPFLIRSDLVLEQIAERASFFKERDNEPGAEEERIDKEDGIGIEDDRSL